MYFHSEIYFSICFAIERLEFSKNNFVSSSMFNDFSFSLEVWIFHPIFSARYLNMDISDSGISMYILNVSPVAFISNHVYICKDINIYQSSIDNRQKINIPTQNPCLPLERLRSSIWALGRLAGNGRRTGTCVSGSPNGLPGVKASEVHRCS